MAYEVLSDPEKRKRYDQFGKDGVDESSMHDANDIFSMFFGGGRRGSSGPRKGEDIRHPLKVGTQGWMRGQWVRGWGGGPSESWPSFYSALRSPLALRWPAGDAG
jgi:curved DNA-binding protein CbpA